MSSQPKGAIKAAVWAAMPTAYADASLGGTLPAPARQVMYAVRRRSRLGDDLSSDYFLKKLLDQYLDDPATDTDAWDVVRDERGSFTEPHTRRDVPLGTIAVRRYLRGVRAHDIVDDEVPQLDMTWPTVGPDGRFGHILYIEKEGFGPFIANAGIAERYDLAIASCKGYSVKAARALIKHLHTFYDVPVFVAHDFDKQGVGIFDTLGDGYIDLGLRLDDINDERWNLGDDAASEAVGYDHDPRPNLRLRGATDEEIGFLARGSTTDANGKETWHGRRVELNALVGAAFTDWLEAKLNEHGVTKVVPDEDTIAAAFRRAYERETLNRAIRQGHVEAQAAADGVEVPDDIVTRVTTGLDADDGLAWDDVLADIVRSAFPVDQWRAER